jgi:hypothetical protein
MLDPIDKSRCSFPIPDFTSEAEEAEWAAALTPEQRMELLCLSLLARYGEEAMARGIDRSHIDVLTMDEFNAIKVQEDEEEERWRLLNGWPARIPILRADKGSTL